VIDSTSMQSVWTMYPPDFLEAVSFYSRLSPGGDANFSTAYALTHAKRWDPAASNVDPELAATTLEWRLWADDLAAAGAPNPKVSDKITDAAGVEWFVVKAVAKLMGGVWWLSCQKGRPSNFR
jgi:hypothetical protein